MIKSVEVRQIFPQETIADRLAEKLENLQTQGYKIISIHETKVRTPRDCSDQGFIIIYDTGESDSRNGLECGCSTCKFKYTKPSVEPCSDCDHGNGLNKRYVPAKED